jgi:hypothetical protein
VREQLETAEQARKIERESRVRNEGGEVDDELVKLIGKWRGASRQAAEELFGKVRDRVNRYVCVCVSRLGCGGSWGNAREEADVLWMF